MLLRDRGARINDDSGLQFGTTALVAAASQGNEQVVKLLLDLGADVNTVGCRSGTALAAAASQGNEQIVNLLLGLGADINIVCDGSNYDTVLAAAAYGGNEKGYISTSYPELCLTISF